MAAAAPAAVASVASAVASSPSSLAAGSVVGGAGGFTLSAAADLLAASGPVASSLGVLAAVIALHETGHLVAALSQGIKVEAFSIGIGPKLLSYRSSAVEGDGFFKGQFSGPAWDDVGLGPEDEKDEENMEVRKVVVVEKNWWGGEKKVVKEELVEKAKEEKGIEVGEAMGG